MADAKSTFLYDDLIEKLERNKYVSSIGIVAVKRDLEALGIEITYSFQGLFLSQWKYALDLLRKLVCWWRLVDSHILLIY